MEKRLTQEEVAHALNMRTWVKGVEDGVAWERGDEAITLHARMAGLTVMVYYQGEVHDVIGEDGGPGDPEKVDLELYQDDKGYHRVETGSPRGDAFLRRYLAWYCPNRD